MGKRGALRHLISTFRHHPHARPSRPGLETLESRQLLSATYFGNDPVVSAVWNGHKVQMVQNQYLVEVSSIADINGMAKKAGFTNVQSLGGNFYSFHSTLSPNQIQAWGNSMPQRVLTVSPNTIAYGANVNLPNDPYINDQWQYHNTGQVVPDPTFDTSGTNAYNFGSQTGTPGADIGADKAWSLVQGDPNYGDPKKQIVVAILDTGIDANHPDLAANIWTNPNEVAGNSADDDGNGFVDDLHGWNFVANNNQPVDDVGHGTHVAGIIGAVGNNATGVSGVIQHVKILPIKILDAQNMASLAGIIAGMNYVTTLKNEGVNIVAANGSFKNADFPFNRLENDAVTRMSNTGTLLVIAAGNDAQNNQGNQIFPAKFSLSQPNVITVAATDNRDQIAFFSNIGATSVNIAAPGLNILSTLPTYSVGTLLENGTVSATEPLNYGYMSGTSMATPMVTGALALMKAAKPDASMLELKTALLNGADRIPALDKTLDATSPLVSTAGRLNVFKSILALLNEQVSVDTSSRGNWTGSYGSQGAVVYGESGTLSTYTNSFASVAVSGASLQVLSNTSNDPDALQTQLNPNTRIASQLVSSSAITLDLTITDGSAHRLSLYQAAFDNKAASQTISLVDPDTGTIFAAYHTGDLKTGEYQTFQLTPPPGLTSGQPYRVRVVITPSAGHNAVLNGLFFDPAATAPSSLVGVSSATGGNWRNNFGSQGALLFGGGSSMGYTNSLSGATLVKKPQFNNLPSALVSTSSNPRNTAAYVAGKNSFDLRVDLGTYDSSPRRLTLYAADFEKAGRAERIELFDDTTGQLLSSALLTNFSAGKYVTFLASGKVRVHVVRLAGPNAVLSAFFVDPAPTAAFDYTGMDTSSSGNWKTFYGADAALVFGSSSAPNNSNSFTYGLASGFGTPILGTFAQSVTITVSGPAYSHKPTPASSTDARFPLDIASGSSRHINAPRETGSTMDLNVKFSDRNLHTVAVYMVDPDKTNTRTQEVDFQLFDPSTGKYYTVASQLVSNFSKGKYVIFNTRQTLTSAPADIRIHVRRVLGRTAVVNGVFFG